MLHKAWIEYCHVIQEKEGGGGGVEGVWLALPWSSATSGKYEKLTLLDALKAFPEVFLHYVLCI